MERFDMARWEEYPEGFLRRHLARYAWVLKNISYKDIVLDVGCGTGYGSMILYTGCSYVKGVDKNKEAIEYATTHYCYPDLEFECTDFENYPDNINDFAQEFHKYDKIIMIESLEHMRDFDVVMHRTYQLLKPTGRLFLTMPVKSLEGDMLHPDHKFEYSEHQLSGLFDAYFTSYKFILPEQQGIMPYKNRRFIMCIAEHPRFKLTKDYSYMEDRA